MPADDLREGVARVFESNPASQIVRGVERVGEMADDAYRYVKAKVWPDRPMNRPATRRGDIRLPAERKSSRSKGR